MLVTAVMAVISGVLSLALILMSFTMSGGVPIGLGVGQMIFSLLTGALGVTSICCALAKK
ncbi:MAG: hypothetical protein Q3965_01785 [Rothia sp. (in: high G+C Gram-positive bacteria)]|nr:hypothetical protein [Rothia sp. (in: high G+C Gram-positive bacteria)]